MLRCRHELCGKGEERRDERQADRVQIVAALQHPCQRNDRSSDKHGKDNRARRDDLSQVRPEHAEVDKARLAFAVDALVSRQTDKPVKADRKNMRIQNTIKYKE